MPSNNRYIRRAGRKYNVDPNVIRGLITVESHGDINAVSPKGAFGLTQFMPGTAAGYNVRPGDPRSQIYGAAHYLHDLGYSQDPMLALSKYNAGPGNPGGAGDYAKNVMAAAGGPGSVKYKGGGGASSSTPLPGTGGGGSYTTYGEDPLLSSLRDLSALTSPSSLATQNYDFLTNLLPQATKHTVPGGVGTAPVSSTGAPAAPRHGAKGVGNFEGQQVAGWIVPYLQYARKHGWKGQITSGFRSFEDQTRIWNSGVRPAARPGTSNHENPNFPGGAVDVSDAAQLDEILRTYPGKRLLKWAGAKDPVHFSYPHGGSY